MVRVIESFVRDRFGSWLCIKPTKLTVGSAEICVAPGTRFTRGTRVVDVDLARLLDEAYEKRRCLRVP